MTARPRTSFRWVDLGFVSGLLAAVALLVSVAAMSDGSVRTGTVRSPSTTVTPAAGPEAEPVVQRWPLTGRPVDPGQADLVGRRVVAVKVDGFGGVPRLYGIERADLVIEELVEGGLSRMIVVFQSTDADRVGPVRSVRTSDAQIVGALRRPVLVFSGGNDQTVASTLSGPMLPFLPLPRDTRSVFWRDGTLEAPHNLFVSIPGVRSAVDAGFAPGALFEIDPDLATAGAPVPAFTVEFSGAAEAGFWWDGSSWVRSLNGRPQLDGSGAPLRVDNVVVLRTHYGRSPFDRRSPEAHPTGGGAAAVYSHGAVRIGLWFRSSAESGWQLTTGDGQPMSLPAGRTWVLLEPDGPPEGVGP